MDLASSVNSQNERFRNIDGHLCRCWLLTTRTVSEFAPAMFEAIMSTERVRRVHGRFCLLSDLGNLRRRWQWLRRRAEAFEPVAEWVQ